MLECFPHPEVERERMVEGTPQDPVQAATAVDPLVGRTLNGRFRIEAPLGAGGMGKVYRAVQMPLERVVAVKVLNPNFPVEKDPAFKRRFMLEASMTSKLRHRNTVTVIDYGQTDDGIFFIAMELIEGQTLAELLARDKTVPWTRVFNITQQVCRSLREAHNLGVVHRDLKPANVMLVDEDGQDTVKVLDFGLVKSFLAGQGDPEVTQAGMFLGSPQYMAPEQAKSVADPRSDVYSLGVLMYQMLVGKPPFVGKDYLEIIFQHVKEPPRKPRDAAPEAAIPPEVEAVVLKCLEKDPGERYQSMDALLEGLRLAASTASPAGTGVFQHRSSPMGPTPPPLGRPRSQPPDATDAQDAIRTQAFPMAAADEGPSLFSQSQRSRATLLPTLGFVAAVLVGFGVVWVVLSRPSESTATAPSSRAPAAEALPRAAAQPPAAAKRVRFHVSSEPSGARVFIGSREMGITPTVVELPAGPEGTATAEFVFVMPGYPPQAATAGGSADVVLEEKLQKRLVVHVPSPLARAPEQAFEGSERLEPAAPPLTTRASAPVPLSPAPEPTELPSISPARAPSLPLKGAAPAAGSIGLAGSPGPQVLSFQDGMTRPVQLSESIPITYSRDAIEQHAEGTMVLRCVITSSGTVQRCRALKTIPLLEQAVLRSVQSRRYKPAELDGHPVSVEYVLAVNVAAPKP